MCVGAAASLALLHPAGIGPVLVDIAGGFLGGWICDIDLNTRSGVGDCFSGLDIIVPLSTIAVADLIFQFGIIDYMVTHSGISNIVGLAAFALLFVIGAIRKGDHRGFMHSFLALSLFTASLAFAFPPIASSFMIGMALHMLLDLTNKRGVQLLFPIGKRYCTGWWDSEGVADKAIRSLSLIALIMLAVWQTTGDIIGSSGISKLVTQAHQNISHLGLSEFQWYLVGMNVATFLFACLDYQRYNYNYRVGKGETPFDDVSTHIQNILTVAGGALGMMVALIVCNIDTRRSWKDVKDIDVVRQGTEGNAYWFVFVASMLISWASIYLAVVNPLELDYHGLSGFNPLDHLPLIGGLLAINAVTFIAFWADRDHKHRRLDLAQLAMLFFCAAGGSIGGIIAMVVTGKKLGSAHFSRGIPALLIANAITIVILILAGIA